MVTAADRGLEMGARMMLARHRLWTLIALLSVLLTAAAARGAEPATEADPWSLCADAIRAAERERGLPPHLLRAVALAEAGRPHDASKATVPWPWTVTAEGRGRFLAAKADAVALVHELRERNVRNIDVGCMQVNLQYHPNAFASFDEALDPAANAAYAAGFLHGLFRESGSWGNAVARYHASIYGRNLQYRGRVMRIWHSLRGRD
jgi:soluble lytic murein transglycosylase-like protein